MRSDILCVVAAPNWRANGVCTHAAEEEEEMGGVCAEEYLLGAGAGPAGAEPSCQSLGTEASRTTTRQVCLGEFGANSSAD